MIQLTLLGGFQARLDSGPPATVPAGKVQALLAYVALPPGRAHPRDLLASLLWGDLAAAEARASLRQALFMLRRVLPGLPLVTDGDTVALDPAAVTVDVAVFERRIAEGTAPALAEAAELYRGDLLAGLAVAEPPFEEWLLGERERLRELALEGLARLLAYHWKAGAVELAVQTALRLLGLDPLQEPVHRTLMRLHVELGRRGAALRQYQQCVGILQRELGVEPEAETQQLYQEILRQRVIQPEPPVGSAPAGPASAGPAAREAAVAGPDAEIPLVGRTAELARLQELLAAAVAGRGHTVAVIGDAGIGKSRLVAELVEKAFRRRARVLLGRSYESEQILPFGPWIDVLRAGHAALKASEPTLAPAWRAELARLLPELGPPPTSPVDARRLFEAVAGLLEHLTLANPMVVILEDVHWADEMSLRLFPFLARRLEGWPLLLVATARGEELPDAPLARHMLEELDHEGHVVTLALEPLSESETLALVGTLAPARTDDAAMARLGEQLWLSSQGNPFMIVETMRSLGHGRAAAEMALPLPRRVREVIARRLERLGARARELAAVAAVVGREFDFALVQSAAGMGENEAAQAMEELVRRRVLHGVGEGFDFTHDRMREVAYGQLLPPRRGLLHRRVAEALETLRMDDLGPHDLALGLHYLEAEVWDKAASHLSRAGGHAAARWANREAVACFEQALGALGRVPASRDRDERDIDLRHRVYGPLLALAQFGRCLNHLRKAEALAEALKDRPRLAKVRTSLAGVLKETDLGEAVDAGLRARAMAADLEDVPTQIVVNIFLAEALISRGEYEEAISCAQWNLTVPELHHTRPRFGQTKYLTRLSSQGYLVLGLAERGAFAEGIRVGEAALSAAEAVDRPHEFLFVSIGAGRVYLLRGGFGRTIAILERVLPPTAREEWPLFFSHAASTLGFAYVLAGRLPEGLALLEQAVAQGVAIQRMSGHALALTLRGEAHLIAGRPDDASSDAREALELARGRGERGWEAWALRLRGEAEACRDPLDMEPAETAFRQALARAEALGMRPLAAHCHLGLGKLHRRAGNCQTAAEHLTVAAGMYREMDMSFWLAQAEAVLHDVG